MSLEDFTDTKKYKAALPALILFNFFIVVLGNYFIPYFTKLYLVVMFGYGIFRSFHNSAGIIIGAWKGVQVLDKIKQEKQQMEIISKDDDKQQMQQSSPAQKYNHAIIIASYNERLELLRDTLSFLSNHKQAKNRFFIYLAMEAHEKDSNKKAQILISEFRGKFKQVGYTQHQLSAFEAKGKASNVNWCAQHLDKQFWSKSGLKSDSFIVTNMDADSWIPEAYFTQIDKYLRPDNQDLYNCVFVPPQIFTRNHMDVPVLCRAVDQFFSHTQLGNIVSFCDVGFPASNYTVSYKLIKKIGFWDTCADAVAEDYHFTLKAYWKTGGKVKSVPIYVATNQASLQTGDGYLKDMFARFKQAQRHAYGSVDCSYSLKMLFERKGNFRSWISAFLTIQNFVLVTCLTFCSFYYTIRLNFLSEFNELDSFINIGLKIYAVNGVLSYLSYFYYKRRATTELYNLKNESVFRAIEFPVVLSFILFFFILPIFSVAPFQIFFNKCEQYHLTKKNLKLKQANN